MNQQQHDEPKEQQEHPPPPIEMSDAMESAWDDDDFGKVVKLLDDGESVNCVDRSDGSTPIMIALYVHHRLEVVQELADRGADLTMVDNDGKNLLHHAVYNYGMLSSSIDWVLANTTIDINSTTTEGETPIMFLLKNNCLNGAKYLVEKGANLFMKNKDGERAIDIHIINDPDIHFINDPAIVLGPVGLQVLQHAKDIRWSSVKQLLLLSKACKFPNDPRLHDIGPFLKSNEAIFSRVQSARLVVSVFTIEGLVRRIASFFINKKLIVKDPAIKKEDEEPDDVRRRIEAALAANEEKNRRTRKG
jgi:hypothetical protein